MKFKIREDRVTTEYGTVDWHVNTSEDEDKNYRVIE